jgi:hypothetical protein
VPDGGFAIDPLSTFEDGTTPDRISTRRNWVFVSCTRFRDGGKNSILGLARGSIQITLDSPMDGHGRNACVSLEVDDADAYFEEWSQNVDVLRPRAGAELSRRRRSRTRPRQRRWRKPSRGAAQWIGRINRLLSSGARSAVACLACAAAFCSDLDRKLS